MALMSFVSNICKQRHTPDPDIQRGVSVVQLSSVGNNCCQKWPTYDSTARTGRSNGRHVQGYRPLRKLHRALPLSASALHNTLKLHCSNYLGVDAQQIAPFAAMGMRRVSGSPATRARPTQAGLCSSLSLPLLCSSARPASRRTQYRASGTAAVMERSSDWHGLYRSNPLRSSSSRCRS